MKMSGGERQGSKGREKLFRCDRTELNESEPFDEASKGQDDEQSRWLRLRLR
jgi:hypothetical protein